MLTVLTPKTRQFCYGKTGSLSRDVCFQPRDASYSIDQSRLVVVFRRDMPGNPDDWNLNQEESDYLFSEIQTTGNATVGFTFDYQRPFPGTRRQITGPWAKPITCANAGWMVSVGFNP